jgi:hypothetical protein
MSKRLADQLEYLYKLLEVRPLSGTNIFCNSDLTVTSKRGMAVNIAIYSD